MQPEGGDVCPRAERTCGVIFRGDRFVEKGLVNTATSPVSSPQRPISHKVGDLAEAQVKALLAEAGWAVDPVISDYGDDLVAQACDEAGNLLPFRVYIQVKGTQRHVPPRRGGLVRYSGIKRSTIRRWLRSDELHVLVLWNVTRGQGIYGFSSDFGDPTELSGVQDGRLKLTIELRAASVLNGASVSGFAHEAFLKWHTLRAKRVLGGLRSIELDELEDDPALGHEIADAGRMFLKEAGAIQEDPHGRVAIAPRFHRHVIQVTARLLELHPVPDDPGEDDIRGVFGQSLILAMLTWNGRQALSSASLELAHRVLEIMYSNVIDSSVRRFKN